MRYYVIINGVNSLTIPGLAIKSLPSISKTLMRNQKETIDGRNGDLITELGYSAYDKTLTIGLFGTYDIDQIIAFFNQKGTIVFSDEADKYYNFTILEQIDFAKLVKFRTANVRIHCQPFKYEVDETPIVIELEAVEDEGTSVTLNNTAEAPLKIDLEGNTSQSGTPTPSSPQEVQVVTGNNTIVVSNKNLFDVTAFENQLVTGKILNDSGVEVADVSSTYSKYMIPVKANTTYYRKGAWQRMYVYDKNKTLLSRGSGVSGFNSSFTVEQDGYIGFQISNSYWASNKGQEQIEIGSQATTYIAHQGQEYEVDLGVENLFNITDGTYTSGSVSVTAAGGIITPNFTSVSSATTISIPITLTLKAGTYTFNNYTNSNYPYCLFRYNGTNIVEVASGDLGKETFTLANDTTFDELRLYFGSTSATYGVLKPQIEKGTKSNSYSQYGVAPIELCKIGTYKDYLYKSGDKWYKHTEIGKVVLDGTENDFAIYNSSASRTVISTGEINDMETLASANITPNLLCNYFTPVSTNTTWAYGMVSRRQQDKKLYITINAGETVDSFKTWLSTHNTDVYYVLATPTEEEITNSELINQLNSLLGAMSYLNQTNINQENSNLAFNMKVSAIKKGSNEATINNTGNIYAKPILELEGSGISGIYIGNTQLLSIDMISDITIDTELMEAYDPDTSALRNRQITGSYENLKLEPGTTKIKFSGEITKATITNYKRWL